MSEQFKITLDPNVPGPVLPGYVIVVNGPVEPQDLLWTPETCSYEEAAISELGARVDNYKRVLRRRE